MGEVDDTTTLAATLSSLASALQSMADAEAAAAASGGSPDAPNAPDATATTNYSTSGDSNYNNLLDNFPLAGQILASVHGNLSLISEDDELRLLNYPSRREDLSTAIPLTVIFALLLITGCIGNLCTAIVIARPKNRYMHTATNYYLFSLAMSDFLFLILGLPQEMYALWQRYPYVFGESFCIIRSYLSEASTYASILTISAFTIERYVAICHPLWAHTMSQLPRAITSIVIIWILAAICAIPPAAQLGIVTQRGPITNRTLEESAQCAQKRTIYDNLFAVSAIVFFIVPMVIVTVLYILIAIELRRSSKMNSQIQKQTSSHLYAGQHSHTGSLSHLHQSTAGKQQTTASNHRTHPAHHHRHQPNHHNYHHHHHQHKSHKHHERPLPTTCCHQHQQNNQANVNTTDLQVTRSQQLLPSASPTNFTANLQVSPANGQLERPKSALGAGDELCSSPTCCLAPDNKQVGGSLAGSLARLQLPSLLGAYHPKVWLWSGGSNSSLAAAGGRPASAATTCCEDGPQVCQCDDKDDDDDEEAPEATNTRRPVSRQHSPLSYHESLIQRNCPTCRRPLASVGAVPTTTTTPASAKLNHLTHHQMSLPHTPISASCNVVQPAQRRHICNNQHLRAVASQQHLINHRHLPHNMHHHRHHHHHHHHHLHHNHHHHNQHHLKALFQQQQASHSRRSAAASSKKSVVRMLVAVVVSFFICWLPFHAQRLLAAYLAKVENQNQLLLDIYAKITYISGVMYYLSSTINPLLYQLMSAKFRLAFKETFKCSLFRCGAILYYCCCCFCLPWRKQHRPPTREAKSTTAGLSVAPSPALKRLRCSPTNSIRAEHTNLTSNGGCCCCCSSCQNQTSGQVQDQHDKQVARAHPAMEAQEPSTSIVSNNLGSSSCCLSCEQQQQQQLQGRPNSIKSTLTALLIRFLPSAGRLARLHSQQQAATTTTMSCQCQARDDHETGNGAPKQQVPTGEGDKQVGDTCGPCTPLLCVHSVVEQQLAVSTAPVRPVQPLGTGTKSVFKLMRGSQTPVGGLSGARKSPHSPCQEDSAGEQHEQAAPDVCVNLPLEQPTRIADHDDDDDQDDEHQDDSQHEAQKLLPSTVTASTTGGRMEQLIRPTTAEPLERPASSGNSSQGTSPDQLASSLQSTTSPSSTNEIIVDPTSAQPAEIYLRQHANDRSPSRRPRTKLDSTESGSSGTGDLVRAAKHNSMQAQPVDGPNDSTRRRRRSLQQMRSFNNNNNNNSNTRDLYHINNKLASDTNQRQVRQRRKSSSASVTAPRLEVDANSQHRARKTSANHNENNNNINQGYMCSSLSSSERHLDSKRLSLSTTTTSAMVLDDNASFSTTNSSFQLTSGCSNNQPLNQSRHSMELVQL